MLFSKLKFFFLRKHKKRELYFPERKIKFFDIRYTNCNIIVLFQLHKGDWIDIIGKGKLTIISSVSAKWLLIFKIICTFGYRNHLIKKAIANTFISFFHEYRNPTTMLYLPHIVKKKERIYEKLKKHYENQNRCFPEVIDYLFHRFQQSSLLQMNLMGMAAKAGKRGNGSLYKACLKGLKSGFIPLLTREGLSGSYLMRNDRGKVIAIFKPFDEELMGPHNPRGMKYRSAFAQRAARQGLFVGENMNREVAANIVDRFVGLNIVPKTEYATFFHYVFYDVSEGLFGRKRWKKKTGSLQKYILDTVPLFGHLISKIELDEFQRLVILDVIIGNLDRHFGNVLFHKEGIFAIDNGLAFPDNDQDSRKKVWSWALVPQASMAFLPHLVVLVMDFDVKVLVGKLKKICHLNLRALKMMQVRVIYLRACIRAYLTPQQIEFFFSSVDWWSMLKNINETKMQVQAEEIIQNWIEKEEIEVKSLE